MARNCCGATCACRVATIDDSSGNPALTVTGTGTQQDPFLLAFQGLQVTDTSAIDLTLIFTDEVGYTLSAALASTSKLDMLGDVNVPAPANGYVLGYDSGTNTWVPMAPTTAPAGTVHTDSSLTGDGSTGAPLAVNEDPAGGLSSGPAGLAMTAQSLNSLVRHFVDETARAAATPAPSLNSLSVLDSAPGFVDYWTGSAWAPLLHIADVVGDEFLTLSGAYDGRPVTILVFQVGVSTDTDGRFEAIGADDLATYAGILSVHVQPVGSVPWIPMVDPDLVDSVTVVAWGLDNAAFASQPVVATVTAHVY